LVDSVPFWTTISRAGLLGAFYAAFDSFTPFNLFFSAITSSGTLLFMRDRWNYYSLFWPLSKKNI
jgi:hypothetical protein